MAGMQCRRQAAQACGRVAWVARACWPGVHVGHPRGTDLPHSPGIYIRMRVLAIKNLVVKLEPCTRKHGTRGSDLAKSRNPDASLLFYQNADSHGLITRANCPKRFHKQCTRSDLLLLLLLLEMSSPSGFKVRTCSPSGFSVLTCSPRGFRDPTSPLLGLVQAPAPSSARRPNSSFT